MIGVFENFRRLILVGIILLMGLVVNAQSSEDELMSIVESNKEDTTEFYALIQLYEIHKKGNMDQAKLYLDQAFGIANKLNFDKGIARANSTLGNYYLELGEMEQADAILAQAKEYYQTKYDPLGEAYFWNQVGSMAHYKGDFESALSGFIEAAKLYELVEDSLGLSDAFHNIGGMHYSQDRFDKAQEYWEKAFEIKRLVNDSIGIVLSVNALSVIYTAQGEYHKALDKLFEALHLAKKNGQEYEMASISGNIGVQHHHLKQYDSSQHYFLISLNIYKSINNNQEILAQYANLGMAAYKMKDGETSVAYFDTCLNLAKELGSAVYLEHAYGGLADANKVLGNYDEAFEWLNKWYHVKDSISGKEVQNQLNELQEKYESEQKDKEIQKVKKSEANALLLAERRTNYLIVGVVVAISSLLIILLYIGRRRDQEQRRRVELEQKALRTQMNPHFIFNSLGAIQQMYVAGELDLANEYMADFGSLMRKILENSGKDLISVKEELKMLSLYLELEKSRTNDLLDYQLDIDPEIDQRGIKIPPMVIQPFVENAIWHGILPLKKKGMVKISLKTTEDINVLSCAVEDNGVGIQNSISREGHDSKGVQITEQRLGTKVVMEQLSPGTRVTFKIKT